MITTEVASLLRDSGGAASNESQVGSHSGRPGARPRSRRRQRTWARSLALSIVTHGALVAAAGLVPEAEPLQTPITVDLVPVEVPPSPAPTEAPAAPREAVAAPTKAVVHRPVRRPRPSPPALAPEVPPAAPPPAPIESTPAPAASAAEAVAGAPGIPSVSGGTVAVAGTSGSGTGGTGSPVHRASPNLGSSPGGLRAGMHAYLERVQALVARGQRYPQLAIRLGLDGVVAVFVRVHPDGSFARPPLVRTSSGHDLLDREALRMVAHAAPFPPLPQGAAGPTELTVPVRFRLEDQ